MKLKIRTEYNSQEREVILAFCAQLGMPVEEFCKRAVFYSINHANMRAAEAQRESLSGPHNAESANAAGDSISTPPQETDSGAALPDTQEVTNPVG